MQEIWIGKIPKGMATHSNIFARKPYGQRSYSPWGLKELDTSEQLCIEENFINISLGTGANSACKVASMFSVKLSLITSMTFNS